MMTKLAAVFDEVQYFAGGAVFLLGITGPVLKGYSAEHQMIVGLGLAVLAHIRMQRASFQKPDRQLLDRAAMRVQTTAVRLE